MLESIENLNSEIEKLADLALIGAASNLDSHFLKQLFYGLENTINKNCQMYNDLLFLKSYLLQDKTDTYIIENKHIEELIDNIIYSKINLNFYDNNFASKIYMPYIVFINAIRLVINFLIKNKIEKIDLELKNKGNKIEIIFDKKIADSNSLFFTSNRNNLWIAKHVLNKHSYDISYVETINPKFIIKPIKKY